MGRPNQKFATIAVDVEGDDPMGMIWAQRMRTRGVPAKHLGECVKAYVDELEDGGSVTLTFIRTDMTRAEIDAIPEV